MLDHLLGKPSANIRRTQALGTALLALLLFRRQRAPWGLGWLSRWDSRVPIWKTIIGWSVIMYLFRHMDDLMGLNAPEPLREYYSRSFYRTAWVFTALDAGFWTAMSIKPKPLRDLMSLVFSLYYLVYTNRAIEKVRKVRALITIDHLRVSWNKAEDNPALRFARWMHSKKLHVDRVVYLPHPSAEMEQAPCHIMFAKPAQMEYRRCRRVVLNFPGGGFVSMGPRSHKDYLSSWAQRTGAIVVSVDYAKAPEYPFPYAINQCFAIYRELVQTNGRCIGLDSSIEPLQIILAGDSAGGNISSAVTLRIIESEENLRLPDGLVLIYGHFNADVRAWMSEEEAEILLGGGGGSKTTDNKKKGEPLAALVSPRDHLHHESPLATTNMDDGYQRRRTKRRPYLDDRVRVVQDDNVGYAPLAMTSSFTYFNDMILSPEMMRAIIIMYVGPHARPDFRTNYYLSPVVAPDHLLAKFPPVYFMCGEKDPLVDDTLLFAARIRKAKQKLCKQQGTTTHVPTSKLYRRRHSQPRVVNSSTQFYIGSTDVSDNDDDGGGESNAGHGQHLLPASLRMSMFAKNTTQPQQQPPPPRQQQPHRQPIIKIKLVKGMSHGFMQMYPLLPEAKRVADTIGDWILELMEGEHPITEFSRCASMVVVATDDTNKLEKTASVVLLTEDEKDEEDEENNSDSSNSNDTVTSNGNSGTPNIDRHGIEVVTAADMVRKRGRDLTNPLN